MTEKGRAAHLSHDDALAIFKEVQEGIIASRDDQSEDVARIELADTEDVAETEAPDESRFFNEDEARNKIAKFLVEMSPDGFERYCAYLLRVFGLQNVTVTGQVGDQGIDGEGDLMINRFVRSKVMFQCKRYVGSVGPKEIRDFRGAILGRAERGVFLTTGQFTRSAKAEAIRENTVPIELIDLDELVELAIEQRVGVEEVSALRVDEEFFTKYKHG